VWSFAGDGGPAPFVTPLAPLPDETHETRFSPGDSVEVGPTDEGFKGSWYAATLLAAEGGPEPGMVQLRYAALEETDGVPLVEWQPRACVRPAPPLVAEGASLSELPEGLPVQMHFNDGWWECAVSEAPVLSKKEEKERKKKLAAHEAACSAAVKAGAPPPACPPDLVEPSDDVAHISFLNYNEAFGRVPRRSLRPAWVWRGGEWFWRGQGGMLQALTTRMADGKVSSTGSVRPMPKRTHVPGGAGVRARPERRERRPFTPSGVSRQRRHPARACRRRLVPAARGGRARARRGRGRRRGRRRRRGERRRVVCPGDGTGGAGGAACP